MGNVCCCCFKRSETDSQTVQEEQDIIFTVYSSSISPEDTGNELTEINAARIAQIGAGQIQSGSSGIPTKKDKGGVDDTISFAEHKKDATQDGQTASFSQPNDLTSFTSQMREFEAENQSNELIPTEPKNAADLSSLHIANLSHKVRNLIQKTIKARTAGWNTPAKNKKFDLVKLHEESAEYGHIQSKFLYGNQKRVRVTNICRIENAYLLCSYFLKKEELLSRYGNVHEQILFHGTSEDRINGIAGVTTILLFCKNSN